MKKLLAWILALAVFALGLLAMWPGSGSSEYDARALTPEDPPEAPSATGSSLAVTGSESSTGERGAPAPGTVDLDQGREHGEAPGLFGSVSSASRPIAGAVVFVHRAGGESGATPGGPFARTETAGDGTYRIDVPVGTPLDVGVVAPGFLPHRALDVVVSTAGERHDVILEEGLALEGRVVDAAGAPVASLALLAYPAGAGLEHSSASLVALRAERRRLAGRGSGYCDGRATTGLGGTFRVAGLTDGRYLLRAGAPGWTLERAPVEAGTTGLVVRAERCAALELRVLASGTDEPVRGARATLNVHVYAVTGPERSFGEYVAHGGAGDVSWTLQPAFLQRVGLDADGATLAFSGEVQGPGHAARSFRTQTVSASDGTARLTMRLEAE